jgi:hypothetical protein
VRPGRLQRIDRIDRISSRHQRRHPRAPAGLDTDPYRGLVIVLAEMLAEHRMQPGYPGRPPGQPCPGQGPAGKVHQPGIVMIFSPVIPNQHEHRRLPPQASQKPAAAGEPSAT